MEQDAGVVPELLTWRFAPEQLDRLRGVAKRDGATLNDLVLRDCFLAIRDWNEKHAGTGRQVLRIMVPFNLRGAGRDHLPAANVMGMVNVDRRFNGLWRWTERGLLRSIRRETRLLKATRLAAGFGSAMAAVGTLGGGMRRVFEKTDRCLTSAVVSNLGRVFENLPLDRREGKLIAGGLVVEAVDAAPPVRKGSGVACMLSTYAGRLSLTMRWDSHAYSAAVARELLGCMAARIERTASDPAGGVVADSSCPAAL